MQSSPIIGKARLGDSFSRGIWAGLEPSEAAGPIRSNSWRLRRVFSMTKSRHPSLPLPQIVVRNLFSR